MKWCCNYLLASIIFLLSVGIQAKAIEVQFSCDKKDGQAMRERLRIDLATIKESIKNSKLNKVSQQTLEKRVQELSAEIEAVPDKLPDGFRTIMPFNDIQAHIFALNAPVLRARGLSALSAWKQNRWDPLFPMQAPEEVPSVLKLNVAMMRNEYRAEVFNLTNATDESITATVNLSGLPGGANPVWVSVREVLFTDTYIHYPIAAALPEAKRIPKGYAITIPAGMTRQIWLEFHPTNQKAGTHKAKIIVDALGLKSINIPLQVKIYPFAYSADPSIAIGGWDYTEGPVNAYDAKLVGQKAFIKYLRGNGINTPWTHTIAYSGCEFDADGHMTHEPDFTSWDAWVDKWKGASYYAIFYQVGDNFYGEQMGTPRFRRMVGEWITSVVKHAQSQGIKPRQILAHLVDEPLKPEQAAVVIAWAEAIKAAQPDVAIYSNPNFDDNSTVDPRYFKGIDVLCPMITQFISSPQSFRDFYVDQQRAGKELMFYACVNGKHLDPISYWRAQFWLDIRYGGKGSFYWAFGDEGGAPSSFNAYSASWHMFSPFFLDPQMGIVDGKHMQAIREGAEDYEYFQMLQKRVAALKVRGVKSTALDAAKRLLVEGPERVMKDNVELMKINWATPNDRSVMDQVRIEVLDALQSLDNVK